MEDPEVLPRRNSCYASFGDSNSSEFEFWVFRNPSCPQPSLSSADELFCDGVLLPLHHLCPPDPPPPLVPDFSTTELPSPATVSMTSYSKNLNSPETFSAKKHHVAKKKKASVTATAAELNINIWPFCRSRSAGNIGTRPLPKAIRNTSSAPCSRSNSKGESISNNIPCKQDGKAFSIWRVRKISAHRSSSDTSPASLKVPRRCRSFDDNPDSVAVDGGRRSKVDRFRNLFSKRIY